MICNFMIFSESVGSGASLSAKRPLQVFCSGFFLQTERKFITAVENESVDN